MLTLWKSQQKAIREGLLGEKSLVISMPTSAGKTKTVELAIYQALKDKADKICVYVVPTRALACEIEESLSKNLCRMGIGVSILYGGYSFSHLEEDIIEDNQVFVLTPEKLDLLIRNNEKFKQKLELIIIDEVHDSASSSPRSLTAELVYSRLLYICEKNKTKVICISAVINNPNDFASWISGNENNVSKIDWRPTRQRLALFTWFKSNNSSVKSAQVRYIPQPESYPSDDFFVPLAFTRNSLTYRNKNKKYPPKNVEVAARLALHYLKTGPTLIFTTTKALVEEIANCLIALLPPLKSTSNLKLEKLATACARILGSDHLLSKAIKLGFCYHHADLPANIRRLVETGVRENSISLIVSTTTLSQGVNLPIKNVIVHSLSQFNQISMSQYANAVGRAGRAGCETEGHIIFCEASDFDKVKQESNTEKSESFITSGIRSLVESRIVSLKTTDDFLDKWALASTQQSRGATISYEKWENRTQVNANKNKQLILSIIDSQILAWILETCIDEINESEIQKILDKLLCNIQAMDFEEELKSFKDSMKSRVISVKSRVHELSKRKLFNSTGLSVGSNEKINIYAQKLALNIESYLIINEVPTEFWQESYKVFKELPEIAKDLKNKNIDALIDWIQGKDYQELAKDYFDGKTEVVVTRIEKVCYAFSWGINSLLRHLEFHAKNRIIPNVFKNLSAFVTHGVPDIAAVYAISLGVFDRQIAIAISKKYQTFYSITDYFQFKDWLFELGFDQWVNIIFEGNIQSLTLEECFENVQRRKIALQPNTREFIVFFDGIESLQTINYDELIIVNNADRLWLTTYDYQKFWQLSGAEIENLKKLDRTEHDLLVTKIDPDKKSIHVQIY